MKMSKILILCTVAACALICSCKENEQEIKEKAAKQIVEAVETTGMAAEQIAEKETFEALKAEIEVYRKLLDICSKDLKRVCSWKEAGYEPSSSGIYLASEGKNSQLFVGPVSESFHECGGADIVVTAESVMVGDEGEAADKCAQLLLKYGIK